MSFLVDTARKDWQRQRRDLAGFAIWLGLPLVIGAMMWLVSGGREGPKPKAHVLVADQDSSFVTRLMLGALGSGSGLVEVESTTLEEGRRKIEKGKGTALLVLPAGFGDAAFRETPVTLELVTNPAQRILPKIVEEELRIVAEGAFYAHRLVGDDLQKMAEGPPKGQSVMPEAWISDFSVRVNRLVERLRGSLSPRLIDLETAAVDEEAKEKKKEPSFAELFMPGLLIMSLLFAARGVADDVWVERQSRTLRRVVMLPRSVVEFLGGKMLFGASLMLAIATLALVVAAVLTDLTWTRVPIAIAWATFSGTVLLAMMLLLQILSPSQRAAEVLTLGLTFPLIMIGGSFFPFEAMPVWMVALGRHTPNGWAVLQLKEIFFGTVHPAALGRAFAAMLATAAGLFAVGVWRFRDAFARE